MPVINKSVNERVNVVNGVSRYRSLAKRIVSDSSGTLTPSSSIAMGGGILGVSHEQEVITNGHRLILAPI